MSEAPRYPKHVFWSDEDHGFIAVAPDLPGSSAFGETESEALTELDQAINSWIEAARAAGNAVPAPSRPASSLPSGKVLVRMPKGLHQRAAMFAEQEDVSLNQFIVVCIAEAVGERLPAVGSGPRRFFDQPVQQIHPTAGQWHQQLTSPTIGGTVSAPIITIVAHASAFGTQYNSGGLGAGRGIPGGMVTAPVQTLPAGFETFAMTAAQTKQDYVWTMIDNKTGKSHARG